MSDPLALFHPLVARWFTETLGTPSAPQRAGWPAIANGDDTLILAPTGTGKTLSAFLWELNALIVDGQAGPLPNAVHLLYVSPLKALNNDVQRNLETPLAQLKDRFWEAGEPFPEIRVAVRTGDTPRNERARMLRKNPHVLITTPESLHILLTSVRGRTMFTHLRAVIVDEIHAVAGTKRGAHLALTLERLGKLAPDARRRVTPQRIGLSATQKPLDEIARFLGGCNPSAERSAQSAEDVRYRPVTVVDCGLVKRMETEVVSPVEDLAHVDGTIWLAVAPLVLRHIRSARTTLVFVNNRGQAERMAARVNQLAGAETALPYHGSLSRERRLMLEERLKNGELRAVITTSSLELGIDVGSVDLVVQLQSPKRVSAALQRVGRAGHTLGAVSRGVFVPTFRDDALEELAILAAMRAGDVEPTRVVQNALDVLAQLIVAMVASDDAWTATDLYDFVRRAYPYHALTRGAFDETLAMLAGKYPSDVAAELDARVHWDRVSDLLTPARASRLVATVSGGTIPDRGLYTVNLPDKTRLGELDEEFVHESRVGDAFQLGSSTWRIASIEHDRVVVTPAPGAAARMPFWHGEFMARSLHLTPRVGALRRTLNEATTIEQLDAIAAEYRADRQTVQSLAEYVQSERKILGVLPDDRQLVLEHFRDEAGAVRMVLHAPFGGRVNAPWGMAIARRLRERLGTDVQVQTTDDGLMLRLPDLSRALEAGLGMAPPTDVVRSLGTEEVERLVLEEVGGSSLFGARFRMNAARALLLPRGNPRRRMPLWLQRLKALDLLQAVQPYPSFPIVVETYRDVLQDAFDLDGLRDVVTRVSNGSLGVRVVETEGPSPFAASLQFGFVIDWLYADDTPRAEQRAALLSLDRALLDELMGAEGADESTLAVLDEVLARRRGTAPGRQARDADELALLVDRAGDVTADELAARVAPPAEWTRGDPLATLRASGRVVDVTIAGERRVILVDAYARYAAAFGAESLGGSAQMPEPLRTAALTPKAARREILSRFVALAGPASADDVRARYGFSAAWSERRLSEMERAGLLVRGSFGADRATVRWCSRRLLEQARRRELAQARKQIEAVDVAAFALFLQRWQHVAADTHADDAEPVIDQLLGLARPAAAWERDYLPARVDRYAPAMLTQLTAGGGVVWAVDPASERLRFFARGTGRLWLAPQRHPEHSEGSTPLSDAARRVYDALRAQGASFTLDLAIATSLGSQRVRDALHELVTAGLVTNDTAESMRDVLRWKPVFGAPGDRRDSAADPTRWLPADFTPSRPVVQRRVNPRSLARWKRPDRPDAASSWGGRWSLVHAPSVLGITDEGGPSDAELVARQWLARYGVVSRDWWRRERPAVSWRAIYHELKRLEFRGEVRRGYFVAGLAGAQFALPEAVELLRAPNDAAEPEPVVLTTSDPANVYTLPLAAGTAVDPLTRPRGAGALLVTVAGRVVVTAEGRGGRLRVREDAGEDTVRAALQALVARLVLPSDRGRRHDVTVETIDGVPASASRWGDVLRAAGFRALGTSMRHYARV